MRIIGNIPHATLKITVFKNVNRFSVKFEDGSVEQTYKFDSRQNIESLGDIHRQLDSVFLQKIESGIAEMKTERLKTLQRNSLQEQEDEFEEII